MPLDAETLSAVRRPTTQANGLPNALYVDEDLFLKERKAVFHDGWAAIGFGKDVPRKGDAVPVNFLGVPLLLLRDKKGELRVFQNVCRHRGMILVSEPTRITGVIRCPYHAWCYGLDGKLKITPDVGGAGVDKHDSVDPDALGLIPVRSAVYLDTVFVNLSGDAPEFEARASGLKERWKEFDKPIYHGGAESSFTLTVNCNWKLAVENYCESYHLPAVHPGLNAYSKIEDHYHIEQEDDFSGQGTMVYNPRLDDSGRAFGRFANLSSKWDSQAEYIAMYPNVLFGVHKDHTFAILLMPQGPEKTTERVEIYYADEAALVPEWSDLRQINSDQWKGVFVEDIDVVEGMQAGRHAPGFDGGRFSPVMDTPTHMFHRWVAERMASAV